MQRILLIEDEKSVASFIQRGLSEEGYDLSIAEDGNTGTKLGASQAYDLIILDIMLPDRNGIEVCRDLRSMGVRTPILFLSALSEVG